MSMQNSGVMEEFFKIAKQKNLLKTAAEKNPYQEDDKTIEEKRLPKPEKHIMEIAHPEPVFVAESRGEGGLVEKEIEHQKKWFEMVNKIPTGSLVGRYASLVSELIKMAELCDDLGQTEAANKLTAAARKALAAEEESGKVRFETGPGGLNILDLDPDEELLERAETDPEEFRRQKLLSEGRPVDCPICGEECTDEEEYWECINKHEDQDRKARFEAGKSSDCPNCMKSHNSEEEWQKCWRQEEEDLPLA